MLISLNLFEVPPPHTEKHSASTYLLRSMVNKHGLPIHQDFGEDRHQNRQEPSILDRLEDLHRISELSSDLDLESDIYNDSSEAVS